VSTPRYLSVPLIVKESPLVATVPGRLALLASRAHGLTVADPPFDLGTFEMSLVWHRRSDSDPGSAWFRREAAQGATPLR
jgi:DNA-binding transcriptional LysR family regulator